MTKFGLLLKDQKHHTAFDVTVRFTEYRRTKMLRNKFAHIVFVNIIILFNWTGNIVF